MQKELTLAERITLLNILPDKGNFVTMKTVKELRDDLYPSDKEVSEYNIRQEGSNITWDTEYSDVTKEIEFGETAQEIIVDRLKELDENENITKNLIPIYKMFIGGE